MFKEDAGLELQLDKTAFLVKGISAQDALHAADTIVKADPSLSHCQRRQAAVGKEIVRVKALPSKPYQAYTPGSRNLVRREGLLVLQGDCIGVV